MKTYQKLFDIVSPRLKNFRDDLEKHDKATLEKWPNRKFLYGYRPTGTSLIHVDFSLNEWFGEDMTYTPIFGTKQQIKDVDEALKILDDELYWILPGASNKWFLYFDGKNLKEVNEERVRLIWRNYIQSLRCSTPFKMDGSKIIK